MYLLVITTLVVAMIGIYTQVLAIQAGRVAANQTALAQTLLVWHAAAVSMASSIIDTSPTYLSGAGLPGGTGCSLNVDVPSVAGYSVCPSPYNTGILIDSNGGTVTNSTITNGNPTPNLIYNQVTGFQECVHLPANCTASGATGCTACSAEYDTTDYRFYSILFESGSGQNYIVTFVPQATVGPSNPAPGFLSTASGTQLSLTASDLLAQLQQSGAPNYSFGTISNGVLTAEGFNTTMNGGTGFQYALPSALNSVTNGAVAVVSIPY